MPVLAWPSPPWPLSLLLLLLLLSLWPTQIHGMTDDLLSSLRDDTRFLFYHGYTNYLAHAFPEDELKPLSCRPQTRNRDDPADIGLNDVLGNYSVTLVDSLSTLAILASDDDEEHARDALQEFQMGVRAMVELYGDGTKDGKGRCGSRACGFDLDSKVQVFETNIRGVGGLLSAHLFVVGDLPIIGYTPVWKKSWRSGKESIDWDGWRYDGQLLRLAHDLAERLLPAFTTETGIPYPRVNLRHGIPFYRDAEEGVCRIDGTSTDPRDITETCAAGAGSLILEFTTLSRLTGDGRFERLAKRAFWAIWHRRSAIGLVGGGIDAESGMWTMPPLSGIGAGIDSFFEYALKSYILLSSLPSPTHNTTGPLVPEDDPQAYLEVWKLAQTALQHHVLRPASTSTHPYYAPSDLLTGAPRYTYIDNLSAYYPGLLVLSGSSRDIDHATELHLLYTALWTRYSALPERWHAHNHLLDPNFRHWSGRPEFIESTYYLYQATRDPWFLRVGEMVLRDVRRRCWTKCGWAVLADVVTGQKGDRMESFFLGETAKYLYLLFSPGHPLSTGEGAVVLSTEGHPLVLPKRLRRGRRMDHGADVGSVVTAPVCAAPPPPLPLTVSHAANRHDLFHAAALAQLHLVPNINPTVTSPLLPPSADSPGVSLADLQSPSNYTFYPWTLPADLIPPKGTSSPIRSAVTSVLTFPNLIPGVPEAEKGMVPLGALQKVVEGVVVRSLSNVRLSMVQESKNLVFPVPGTEYGVMGERGQMVEASGKEFRIQGIANWALGKEEKVLVSEGALEGVSPGDPHFTRVKDLEMVDLVVDVPGGSDEGEDKVARRYEEEDVTLGGLWQELEAAFTGLLSDATAAVMQTDDPALPGSQQVDAGDQYPLLQRSLIPAILPTGPGAAPLPPSIPSDPLTLPSGQLPYRSIYYLDSTLCPPNRLSAHIAKENNILIIRRGGCSFSEKLANIPAFAPNADALQLVIVLSGVEAQGQQEREGRGLIRPFLDEVQRSPSGFARREGLAMVMVDGSAENVEMLRRVARVVGSFREDGKVVEEERRREGQAGGVGLKRRYWFESEGIPIGNLHLVG